MRLLLLTILITFFFLRAVCQNAPTAGPKTAEPDFKNAGEQEEYWVADLFKNHYQRESYPKYTGKIIAKGDDFIYGKEVINLYAPPELNTLFDKGIIYPVLVLFANVSGLDTSVKVRLMPQSSAPKIDQSSLPDKAQSQPKSPMNLDSLFIGDFQELKALETNPKQKRFRFLFVIKGLSNPILHVMELTNDSATYKTDFSTFVNGASLTFLRQVSVLL